MAAAAAPGVLRVRFRLEGAASATSVAVPSDADLAAVRDRIHAALAPGLDHVAASDLELATATYHNDPRAPVSLIPPDAELLVLRRAAVLRGSSSSADPAAPATPTSTGGRTILERLDKVAQFVERLVADADGRRRVTLLSDLEPPHVERICRHLGVTWWERDLEVGQAAAAAAAPYEGQAAPVGSVRAHRLTWLKQNVRMASRYMWVDDDVVAESDEPFLPFAVTGRADAVIATATAVRCFFALDGVVVNFALMAQMDDFASEAAQARAQHILYAWMAGHPVVTVLTDLRAVWVFHWTEAAGVLCCGRAPSYRHALLWISELVSAREGQLPASLRNRVLWTDVDNAPAAHTQTNR